MKSQPRDKTRDSKKKIPLSLNKTSITSDIMSYNKPFFGCAGALQVGKIRSLPRNSSVKARGKICYISYGHADLNQRYF